MTQQQKNPLKIQSDFDAPDTVRDIEGPEGPGGPDVVVNDWSALHAYEGPDRRSGSPAAPPVERRQSRQD